MWYSNNNRFIQYNRIQINYENLIVEYPTLSITKDLNEQLWKQCFYYDIEEYRYSIKDVVAIIDSNKPDDLSKKQKASDKIVKLMTEFKTFLMKAASFYNSMLMKVCFADF